MATKIGNWIFNKWPGMLIVGTMRCGQCGVRLNGEPNEYCYMPDTVNNTNIFQCSKCGEHEPHWQQLNAQRAEAAHKQWLDYARTDCDVLLQRIKDAFYEGYASPQFERHYEEVTNVDEEWEYSEAKEVYDTLAKLWSVQ